METIVLEIIDLNDKENGYWIRLTKRFDFEFLLAELGIEVVFLWSTQYQRSFDRQHPTDVQWYQFPIHLPSQSLFWLDHVVYEVGIHAQPWTDSQHHHPVAMIESTPWDPSRASPEIEKSACCIIYLMYYVDHEMTSIAEYHRCPCSDRDRDVYSGFLLGHKWQSRLDLNPVDNRNALLSQGQGVSGLWRSYLPATKATESQLERERVIVTDRTWNAWPQNLMWRAYCNLPLSFAVTHVG